MKNINIILVKTDRIAAWVLLGSVVLYLLSGYGITKGIINSQTASVLHKNILPLITVITFAVHTFLAIRLFFMRNNRWNKFTKTLLISVYLFFLIFFVYIELFYQPHTPDPQTNTNAIKVFNRAELLKYNGKDGNPAYAAVDGVVYDVSTVFKNGIHYSHLAGQELTDAFYTKHVKSQITKYPVMGTFAE